MKYDVTFYIVGRIVRELEADSEEQAIEEAKEDAEYWFENSPRDFSDIKFHHIKKSK